MLLLPAHDRYEHVNINSRKDYSWPDGKRLAMYIACNVDHFAFGTGLGADPAHRPGEQTSPGGRPAVELFVGRGKRVAARGRSHPGKNSMTHVLPAIHRFLASEDGPTAVEYAVMLALILVACITLVQTLGTTVSGNFDAVSTKITGS